MGTNIVNLTTSSLISQSDTQKIAWSSSPSCSSLPPVMEDGKFSNWAELPSDLTFSILLRVSVSDKLKNVQNVCRSWRRVCRDPITWRKLIDTRGLENLESMQTMCRRAVDLSRGGLLEINIEDFGHNSLLAYIADRSSHLKRLRIAEYKEITNLGLMKAVMKLPLLEELELSYCYFDDVFDLKGVGFACPNLVTLKVNYVGFFYKQVECDDDALAIAESMTKLRHLQLLGNRLSHRGLIAILDNCPHLEHLDLRHGLKLSLVGGLDKFEAFREIKNSAADYPFDDMLIDTDDEDDYTDTDEYEDTDEDENEDEDEDEDEDTSNKLGYSVFIDYGISSDVDYPFDMEY